MDNQIEREIDLVDLLFHVLCRWRSIILFALIGVVLLGAYKFYSSEQTRAKIEEMIVDGKEDEIIYPSDYQSAIDALETKERSIRELEVKITDNDTDILELKNNIKGENDAITSLENDIKITNERIEEANKQLSILNEYIENTVLLDIDATSEPYARKSYQVISFTDKNVVDALYRDPVDEIVAAYVTNITLNDDKNPITEKYGISKKYIDELYSVYCDGTTNLITVAAYGSSKEMAMDICDYICALVEARQAEITARYSAHTLQEVFFDYREIVNEGLADTQSNRREEVLGYESKINSCTLSVSNMETSIEVKKSQIENYEKQIENLEEDNDELSVDIKKLKKDIIENKLEEKILAKEPSFDRSFKDAIKFAVIGGVVMAIVMVLLYAALYLLNGKMHTANEISLYYNIPVLAVLTRKPLRKKLGALDKWLNKLRDGEENNTDEYLLKNAAASLKVIAKDAKNLVVYSSKKEDEVVEMTKRLSGYMTGVQFTAVSSSSMRPENSSLLSNADAIILFEEREEATIKAINSEVEQTAIYEKKVLGAVIA